jgi:hypothetical protein
VSWQPADNTYVGGPYVSPGLGGFGPGVSGGVSAVNGALVIAAEFSAAWISVEQSGRLVGSAATNHLHDAMVSGLIGHNSRRYKTLAHSLIGAAVMVSDRDRSRWPLVLTGGIDLVHPLSRRASLTISGRYTFMPRTQYWQYVGVGAHVFRAGLGVRIRVGN